MKIFFLYYFIQKCFLIFFYTPFFWLKYGSVGQLYYVLTFRKSGFFSSDLCFFFLYPVYFHFLFPKMRLVFFREALVLRKFAIKGKIFMQPHTFFFQRHSVQSLRVHLSIFRQTISFQFIISFNFFPGSFSFKNITILKKK